MDADGVGYFIPADKEFTSDGKIDEVRMLCRKNSKPMMEKRRRARINSCLTQLKMSVLHAMKKDNAQFSKLEKADILELTVKHLRTVQRQQMTAAMASDPGVLVKYQEGYTECADEVMRYLNTVQGMNEEMKCRVMAHLSNCMHNLPPETRDAARHTTTSIHPAFIAHAPSTMPWGSSIAARELPVDILCNNYTASAKANSMAESMIGTQHMLPTAPVAIVLATRSPLQAIPLYTLPPGDIRMQQCIALSAKPTTSYPINLGNAEPSLIRCPEIQRLPRSAEIPKSADVWRPW